MPFCTYFQSLTLVTNLSPFPRPFRLEETKLITILCSCQSSMFRLFRRNSGCRPLRRCRVAGGLKWTTSTELLMRFKKRKSRLFSVFVCRVFKPCDAVASLVGLNGLGPSTKLLMRLLRSRKEFCLPLFPLSLFSNALTQKRRVV